MASSSASPLTAPHGEVEARSTARAAPDDTDAFVESQSGTTRRIRKLVAGERYFGLEARAFHACAERVLAGVAARPSGESPIDLRSLGEDFCVAGTARSTLLTELLRGGLLEPDGRGGYRPTALFREYATACIVAPLARSRARSLVEQAVNLAARINSSWHRNPYLIDAIAVSGSYMKRCDPVKEVALWLVVRARVARGRTHRRLPLKEDPAVRQMGSAMKALSSFVTVRVVSDRQNIARPFAIVFQRPEETLGKPEHGRGGGWRAIASMLRGGK